MSRPRLGEKRWIIYNDGAGEIADYLVVEELQTGEVSLALWHAKAAHGSVPSIRIKDFQEVVAQALRSRRWFPSTSLWVELGSRLAQRSRPWATLVDRSDDLDLLNRKLGLVEDETVSPWTKRFPNVRGTLGIVQPGLSAGAMRTALGSDPIPAAAQSLQELFSVLSDTALSDGAKLVLLVFKLTGRREGNGN